MLFAAFFFSGVYLHRLHTSVALTIAMALLYALRCTRHSISPTHLILHFTLLVCGLYSHRHYDSQLVRDVINFDTHLSANVSCLYQIDSLPYSSPKSPRTQQFRARILSCSRWHPLTPIAINLAHRGEPYRYGDMLYGPVLSNITSQFILLCRPQSVRSSRTVQPMRLSARHLQHVYEPNFYPQPLTHIRRYVIDYFLMYHHPLLQHPHAGLLLALLFGEQRALTPSHWLVLKHAAISHLVAISGLHITLVARCLQMPLCFLSARLGLQQPALVSRILGSFILFIYIVIVGMSPSCMRAFIMHCVMCVATQCYQRLQPLHCLSVSAVLHYFIDPGHFDHIGCQLSYGIVASLMLAHRYQRIIPQFFHWLISPTIAGIWSYAYWGEVMLISPITNAFAIPFVSWLILPLTLLAFVSSFISIVTSRFLFEGVMLSWTLLFTILEWIVLPNDVSE